jgi:hypothetical protein
MNGGSPMTLDDEGFHAVVSEQERRGHSYQASACNENWNFEVGHTGKLRDVSRIVNTPFADYNRRDNEEHS